MSDLYFKKSSDRGKVYMRIHSKKDGYVLNLGSPEKCIKDSVRLKLLEKQTEKYRKMLTELLGKDFDKLTENDIQQKK